MLLSLLSPSRTIPFFSQQCYTNPKFTNIFLFANKYNEYGIYTKNYKGVFYE